MSDLVSVEDAWARLSTHIDWADRFWIAFVFTDDPRVIEALGQRALGQLSAAGRGFVSLRPSKSEAIDEVFEALLGGEKAAVAWIDLVRHDAPSRPGVWQAAWERLMLRLNERRELLRRRWSKGGIVFATTLARFDETPALAPDLWTIRAMALRVGSLPAEDMGKDIREPFVRERRVTRRNFNGRSAQLARQAAERARTRGDDLGLLEILVALGAESREVVSEARALADRLLKERTDDEGRSRIAASLEALAEVLARSGSYPVPGEAERAHLALELMQKSVEIRRTLTQTSANAHLGDLASSLETLGIRLSMLGRQDEALTAAQEAADYYRKLTESNADLYLPDLASALNNLGLIWSSLGRREAARAVTQEAVGYFRDLAEVGPYAFLPELAHALKNLAGCLNSLGRQEEALATAQEAVEHSRTLTHASPDLYLPDLARALNTLGTILSSLGRQEEALAATEEAVDMQRQLANSNPDMLPELASALNNLGNRLSSLGRSEEAMRAAQEAFELYRKLAETIPDAFLPDLAVALGNLGNHLSTLGRVEEALAATEEAVEHYRRLAKASPDVFIPGLAMALNNLGGRLSSLGRVEEALAATEEAVEHYRRLAKVNPYAFLPRLATALTNVGGYSSSLGRVEEAMAATEEAVEIRRKLALLSSDAFARDLAVTLVVLGAVHARAGEYQFASDCWAEALENILPSFTKLRTDQQKTTVQLARALHALSKEHGVNIQGNIASVIARLLDDDQPANDR